MSQRKLRVLLLVHRDLIPPAHPTAAEIQDAPWAAEYQVATTLQSMGHEVRYVGLYDHIGDLRTAVWDFKPQLAFNLAEEFDGVAHYDQNIVSFLELMKVPYTGCNPRGLMVARDKALTKKILAFHQIRTPAFHVFGRQGIQKPTAELQFPLIVKSVTEEASLGISQASVVQNESQLKERVNFIHEHLETDAIAEQYIAGRELYVGMLGNLRTEAFPVWELFFGKMANQAEPIATQRVKWSRKYRERYQISSGKAEIASDEETKAQEICRKAYRALGLSGYARVDLRLAPSGEMYVLEANPNCHIGEKEDFAQSAHSKGLPYSELLWRILNLGLRWQPNRG
jgi:D-alanine-D-alanine ligase